MERTVSQKRLSEAVGYVQMLTRRSCAPRTSPLGF